jgi:hypothetical protein
MTFSVNEEKSCYQYPLTNANNTQENSFTLLPKEISLIIFRSLPTHDLGNLAQTSRHMHDLTTDLTNDDSGKNVFP